ncbi:MAG TPA: deoxyribonuclease IV [Candidatus Omnitrophota bacterium]|nr:deoxyribonuclease IV [Candidatus Omnitrophota bacterium]HPT07065.1 deoxyribonuclease IV [Candidatus Omnitrophota bacterium]
MILGVHTSTQGGIQNAILRAHELGCNTLQIFSRNPQQWRSVALDAGRVAEFRFFRKEYHIDPVFIHIPYLINLASPNPRLYKASVQAYIEDIQEAACLEADFIVTHMGSHKDTTEIGGIRRFARALNKIIGKTADSNVGILLENTAGSGSWLGYKFSHQRKVLEHVKDPARIGLCLDTAHAYAAGYDLATPEGLAKLLDDVDKNVGVQRIKLIHLNDTPEKLKSRRDHHTHIGEGNIGLAGMKRIINHETLRDCAFILETPKMVPQDDARNLAVVRTLRKEV